MSVRQSGLVGSNAEGFEDVLRLGFEFQHFCFLTVLAGASSLISLSLSFLICKMEQSASAERGCYEN